MNWSPLAGPSIASSVPVGIGSRTGTRHRTGSPIGMCSAGRMPSRAISGASQAHGGPIAERHQRSRRAARTGVKPPAGRFWASRRIFATPRYVILTGQWAHISSGAFCSWSRPCSGSCLLHSLWCNLRPAGPSNRSSPSWPEPRPAPRHVFPGRREATLAAAAWRKGPHRSTRRARSTVARRVSIPSSSRSLKSSSASISRPTSALRWCSGTTFALTSERAISAMSASCSWSRRSCQYRCRSESGWRC